MRMMSCGKWAPLKLIIRALPPSATPGYRGRSYLKSCISKICDRAVRSAVTRSTREGRTTTLNQHGEAVLVLIGNLMVLRRVQQVA